MADSEGAPRSAPAGEEIFPADYPWHARAWSALTGDLSRLSHALLFHGPAGLGKRAFARRLAETLLCAEPGVDAAACGRCASCGHMRSGAHPDWLYVQPLADSLVISIDQIRELRDFVAFKPHTAARKLVILDPAEAMNLNAANALLKVLEEPPPSSMLLLVTAHASRVPATIRSRCVLVPFRAPASAEAVPWLRAQGVDDAADQLLRLAGGAPLRALASARSSELPKHDRLLKDLTALQTGGEDPLRCAGRWKDYGAEECLEWLHRHIADRIRTEMEREAASAGSDINYRRLKDLFHYLDVLSEARALIPGPLDQLLLLEDMLIRWTRLRRSMV